MSSDFNQAVLHALEEIREDQREIRREQREGFNQVNNYLAIQNGRLRKAEVNITKVQTVMFSVLIPAIGFAVYGLWDLVSKLWT